MALSRLTLELGAFLICQQSFLVCVRCRVRNPVRLHRAFAANGPVPLRRTADGRRYAFDLKSNGAVLVVFEM